MIKQIIGEKMDYIVCAQAIRKRLEAIQDSAEINYIRSRLENSFFPKWDDSGFADFCTQFIVLSQFIDQILQGNWNNRVDFLNLTQDLSNLSTLQEEISNFQSIFDIQALEGGLLRNYKEYPEDVITRCYETFLRSYDKHARDALGTFYTPPPLVDFIIHSVDHLLKTKFGQKNGIMDAKCSFLDPASGTNVFLSRALRYILKQNSAPHLKFPRFPREFLKNYETREIQPTTFVLGLFNILSLLSTEWREETLTDIPWNCKMKDTLAHFEEDIKDNIASSTKKSTPIVVWGNPPYKKDVKTESCAIAEAMKQYQDTVRFEKSLRVLSDYYVKFLRYAHERVKIAGHGIISLVLNSSYIDGPIHRGLRASLIQDFSDIFVVNLHGAIQPPEITPSGVEDENVFDIRTGVSILILVKSNTGAIPCEKLHYYDCWGTRVEKLDFLAKNGLNSIAWKKFDPRRWGISYNQFNLAGIPTSIVETYRKGISIRNIFKSMVMGVTSGRDQVLVGFTRDELYQKILESRKILHLPSRLTIASIKKDVIPYNYRPFDFRYIYYKNGIINRDRKEIMNYLVGKQKISGNVALVTERFIRSAKTPYWNFIYATNIVPDKSCISNQDNSHVYPLYYGSVKGHQDNLRKEVVIFLSREYCIPVISTQVFDYILGILSTPRFQEHFTPLLGLDYPVILFPKESSVFMKIANLGSQIKNVFLLAEETPNTFFHSTAAKKSLVYNITHVHYDSNCERLYYNPVEYVESPQNIWNIFIGYFQPIRHFFSDRIGRILTNDEIDNVNHMISNLLELTKIFQKLDAIYESIQEFLDCSPMLINIIKKEVRKTHYIPISNLTHIPDNISTVRRNLYLPDDRLLEEALK